MQRQALTLIELLLATAILAMVAAGLAPFMADLVQEQRRLQFESEAIDHLWALPAERLQAIAQAGSGQLEHGWRMRMKPLLDRSQLDPEQTPLYPAGYFLCILDHPDCKDVLQTVRLITAAEVADASP